jgi:hypothetical protein
MSAVLSLSGHGAPFKFWGSFARVRISGSASGHVSAPDNPISQPRLIDAAPVMYKATATEGLQNTLQSSLYLTAPEGHPKLRATHHLNNASHSTCILMTNGQPPLTPAQVPNIMGRPATIGGSTRGAYQSNKPAYWRRTSRAPTSSSPHKANVICGIPSRKRKTSCRPATA